MAILDALIALVFIVIAWLFAETGNTNWWVFVVAALYFSIQSLWRNHADT